MKKRFKCSICLLLLLLLLSSCGNQTEVSTVNEYTPEQIGNMLIAFCTTNKDERYTKLLEGIAEIENKTALPTNATPGIIVNQTADPLIADYHSEIAAYMTDNLMDRIIGNRELFRLDKSADIMKVSIKADRAEIVEMSGEDSRYEFNIYAELTDANGEIINTVQHGYFVMKDGLVDSISFDDGMKGLFGIAQ